jgi:hypothetical protein
MYVTLGTCYSVWVTVWYALFTKLCRDAQSTKHNIMVYAVHILLHSHMFQSIRIIIPERLLNPSVVRHYAVWYIHVHSIKYEL